MERLVDEMKTSDYEPYRILGIIIKTDSVNISPVTYSGKRTVSHDSWVEADKMILDKVLSDERSTAYATTIEDINKWWLECKECNWYKSEQSILSEARLSI